jgi:creatinine amidohydrolase/Fe(II)-dependent formamide hydrolase-like protein
MGSLSQSGVFGDATAADAEKGGRWLDAVVEKMVELWQNFLCEHHLLT